MATTSASPQLLSERELGAWRGLLHAHTTLVKALDGEMVAEHGLALTSYEVLLFLAESPDGKMRMHDLASSVLLSRSGLTRLCDRLERDALITRKACDSDARGAFAVITDAGRRKLESARRTHLAGVRRHFLSRLDDADLDRLAEIWVKVLPAD